MIIPAKKRYPLYVDTHERERLFTLFRKKCKQDKVTILKRLWTLIELDVQSDSDVTTYEDIVGIIDNLELKIKEWKYKEDAENES